MKKQIAVFAVSACLMLSCTQERVPVGEDSSEHFRALSSVQVPLSRLPLYADISKYNLHEQPEKTKAEPEKTKAEEEQLTLESLLDMTSVSEVETDGQHFIQIPFKQNTEPILASVQDTLMSAKGLAVQLRKYYVRMHCKSGLYEYVATLVPRFGYDAGYPDYDFLFRPNYSGIVLFSTLEGRLFEVRTYLNGRIVAGRLVSRDEIPACGDMELQYVVLYGEEMETKGDDEVIHLEDEGVQSICIASRSKGGETAGGWDWYDWWEHYEETDDVSTEDDGGGGGGGGDADSPRVEVEYNVSLSSNVPEILGMEGSGTYASGTKVAISYHYNYLVSQCKFRYWTGTFEGYNNCTFVYTVKKDVVSTAYFDDDHPCRDAARGVVNPLKSLLVAPSGGWNYKGGTYGMTRNGGTRMHSGLDLVAAPGTPLYAMYSGTVEYIKSDAPETHEPNDFGNEIVIACVVNGQTLYFQYAHLQFGTPVAINPRTWEPFKEGDKVFAGDLVAYSGKTGNAVKDSEVPVKHLHLGVSTTWGSSGKNWIDPAPYINGTVDAENIMNNKGVINDIVCD